MNVQNSNKNMSLSVLRTETKYEREVSVSTPLLYESICCEGSPVPPTTPPYPTHPPILTIRIALFQGKRLLPLDIVTLGVNTQTSEYMEQKTNRRAAQQFSLVLIIN